MIVGFSGTRHGMTAEQLHMVDVLLLMSQFRVRRHPAEKFEFHHGDCIGADEEADAAARICHYNIHIHPCREMGNIFRAGCHLRGVSHMYPIGNSLDRNRAIVDVADVVLCAPAEDVERPRGGTWFTYRYALTRPVDVLLIHPNGTVIKRLNPQPRLI